jgi:signal transduction histidine kinase
LRAVDVARSGLGTNAKANLKIICQSGEHLLGLITDILDMSKIEAGRTELNPTTFNFSRLVENLASMFHLWAQAKALRFEVLVDGESVTYVVADEGKIRQVLINLLGNAIKFTVRGHIKLHVTLHRRTEHRLWLSAQIEDTGPGLTDAEQRKLFQPFNQFKRGLKLQEGTGLGLAIGRSYARLMGGDITLISKPGEGSIIPIRNSDRDRQRRSRLRAPCCSQRWCTRRGRAATGSVGRTTFHSEPGPTRGTAPRIDSINCIMR